MSNLTRFAVLPLVFALAACGGKSSAIDDASGGGTGAGGAGSGGAGHAGGTSVSGASAICTQYDDDSPVAIDVEMLNMTDAAIYLGQEMTTCAVDPLFRVADARGGALSSIGNCRNPCSALRTGGAVGCPDICLFPTSVALQPGETRSVIWDGLYSLQSTVPAQCAALGAAEAPSLSCDSAKRIEPGTYMFSARAGTGIDCSETTGAGSCSPCKPDGNGGCVASGSLINGTILTARATVLLDQSYGIYGSGSGSAGSPTPGGNSSGAIATPIVNLVFTNP